MAETTIDTFFNHRFKVVQPLSGYRFSIDAVLLAHAVRPQADDRVLDLGTGVGIIPLILAQRHPHLQLFGVEIQPELTELAKRNVALNRLNDRIAIRHADLRTVKGDWLDPPPDWVVCNPPYVRFGSGRVNPHPQKAVARHEIQATLADVIAAAHRLLGCGGHFAAIYPIERLTDMLFEMRSAGIEPQTLRWICPRAAVDPLRFIVVGCKAERLRLRIQPPLVIYGADGNYAAEVAAMFQP